MIDPFVAQRDFLQTRDLQTLAALDDADEFGGFHERFMRAGVEPSRATAELFDLEVAFLQIETVQVGNLEFAPGRGFQVAGKSHHSVIVEIKARHGEVRLRLGGLLLDREDASIGRELHHAVGCRLRNMVTKNRGPRATRISRLDGLNEVLPVENIVAQHKGGWSIAHKVRSDVERLCKPLRTRLGGVAQRNAKLAAITEQALEERQILRRGNQQNLSDARQHEHRQRIVNHRLVIHRHELLAHRDGEWIQPRARASGENDAFA